MMAPRGDKMIFTIGDAHHPDDTCLLTGAQPQPMIQNHRRDAEKENDVITVPTRIARQKLMAADIYQSPTISVTVAGRYSRGYECLTMRI